MDTSRRLQDESGLSERDFGATAGLSDRFRLLLTQFRNNGPTGPEQDRRRPTGKGGKT